MEKVQGEVVSVQGKPILPNLNDSSVVKNAVVTKKQSKLRKLWRGFFAEDLKTIKGNIVHDIVVPSVKNGIANAITSAVHMALFGKNGGYNIPGGYYRPYNNGYTGINYNKIYTAQNGTVVNPRGSSGPSITQGDTLNAGRYTPTDVYDPYALQYATYQDAEGVYFELCKKISSYGVASVSNLYGASGVTDYDVITTKWGWYNIPTHQIIPTGNTWVLRLPMPVPIT